MLIRPSLLPDEMDRGYLGRVEKWNGYEGLKDKKATLETMRDWLGEEINPAPGETGATIKLLSRVAGVEIEQFVADHTLLSWRRAITPYKTHVEHGSAAEESILSNTGFRVSRPGAVFCKDCIQDDQETLGFSYWRRSHQLPGKCLCEKHQTPLYMVRDEWAFLLAPAFWYDHPKTHEIPSLGLAHPFVAKFYAIAAMLSSRSIPLSTRIIRRVMAQRGREMNLQCNADDVRRPLLSDLIARTFPADWLEDVFPPAKKNRPGKLFNQLDGVFYFANGPSSVEAYFLALAVLFDTTEDIAKAIDIEGAKPHRARARKPHPEADTLLQAYLAQKGSHAGVAKQCEASIFVVTQLLNKMGLPNLVVGRSRSSVLEACRAFYVEKCGFAESAARGGISVKQLEAVLRVASPELMRAVEVMLEDTGRGGELAA
jgi:hypothetical protein